MTDTTLTTRPLYRRVQDALVKRIADGQWQPGEIIPSEFEIARELGVSQGTVRKALDAMAASNLLTRRQGKGTFVARHDEARILFQFFKLTPDDGERRFPESVVESVQRVRAGPEAAERLAIGQRDMVLRIRRVRSLGGEPAIVETITLPATLFPGLEKEAVPNNLYGTYADRYGVTVARAVEKLKAVAATEADASALGLPAGTALLLIDRLATGLDGAPIEWRVSLCRSDRFHYLSDLV